MNAAYHRKAPELPVSRTAVYAKLNGIEPEVSAALLRHGRQPLSACIHEMKGTLPTWVEGVSGSDSGWQLLGQDRPSVAETPSLCGSTMTGQNFILHGFCSIQLVGYCSSGTESDSWDRQSKGQSILVLSG